MKIESIKYWVRSVVLVFLISLISNVLGVILTTLIPNFSNASAYFSRLLPTVSFLVWGIVLIYFVIRLSHKYGNPIKTIAGHVFTFLFVSLIAGALLSPWPLVESNYIGLKGGSFNDINTFVYQEDSSKLNDEIKDYKEEDLPYIGRAFVFWPTAVLHGYDPAYLDDYEIHNKIELFFFYLNTGLFSLLEYALTTIKVFPFNFAVYLYLFFKEGEGYNFDSLG